MILVTIFFNFPNWSLFLLMFLILTVILSFSISFPVDLFSFILSLMSGLSWNHCPVLPPSQANPGKGYLTMSSS